MSTNLPSIIQEHIIHHTPFRGVVWLLIIIVIIAFLYFMHNQDKLEKKNKRNKTKKHTKQHRIPSSSTNILGYLPQNKIHNENNELDPFNSQQNTPNGTKKRNNHVRINDQIEIQNELNDLDYVSLDGVDNGKQDTLSFLDADSGSADSDLSKYL
jgi:predicted Holliday junction resolvase-like endonuclease